MLFHEGESVKYNRVAGVIAFVCDNSISILVEKGEHRSKDVRVVVYKSDFNKIDKLIDK
jgi:hypothetical protein